MIWRCQFRSLAGLRHCGRYTHMYIASPLCRPSSRLKTHTCRAAGAYLAPSSYRVVGECKPTLGSTLHGEATSAVMIA